MSLKAKGLLSLMLSLPETWDYTLSGLARISLEGKDAIRAAVVELEGGVYSARPNHRQGRQIQRQRVHHTGVPSRPGTVVGRTVVGKPDDGKTGDGFHADGKHATGFSNANKYRRK